MSDIIRNKNRFTKRKIRRYQPEYVRLNRDPEKNDTSVLEGFGMNRRIPFVAGRATLDSNVKNKKTKHQENTVFISKPKDDYSVVTGSVPFSSIDHLEKESNRINEQKFKFDEVDVPNTPNNATNQEQNDLLVTDISDGDYCLFLNNEIVFSSSSMEEIEEVIEDILFESKIAKHEDIAVFKKMNIKFGISIR